MTDKEIAEKEAAEHKTPVQEVSASKIERTLCINRDDRIGWLLILAACLVIIATFNYPFQWMLDQWMFVEEYSPGPLVPLLMVIILWSRLKKLKSRPGCSKKELAIPVAVIAVLAAVAYFAKSNRREYPQYEIYSEIAYGILFYVLTALLVYAAYLFARGQELDIAETDKKKSDVVLLGMLAILVGLGFHFLGMRGDLNRVSILAYILTMYGFVWYVFGKDIGKKLMFPFAFLLFMIPMEFLDDYLGGPLRIFASRISVGTLKGIGAIIGMEVVRKGTQFTINGNPFDVAPACSGLRSLVALSAIGAAYAFITQPGILRKWLLGICAVPIALFTNIVRLTLVGITCHFFGQKTAMHVHDSSIFLYILAILFLFSLDRIFSRISKSEWVKAKLTWLKTRDF